MGSRSEDPVREDLTTTRTESETSRQLRGSTALLAGRAISLVVNFGVKILLVRWLARTEFGAFAYGFAMVPVARTLVALGQSNVVGRFLSIDHEGEDHGRFVGTVVTVSGGILILGVVLTLAVLVTGDTLILPLIGDRTAVVALTILVILGPIEALDRVWEAVLAVLAKPSEIFVRRYVIGPVSLVGAILITVAFDGGATAFAWAFVAAAVATTIVSAGLSLRAMRRKGVLRSLQWGSLTFPFRELYGFSTPLVLTELLPIVLGPIATAIVGANGSTEEVASYQAVLPVARFNQTAIATFTILYVPLAARLYARNDRVGTADAYWRTASWLMLLSAPALTLTTVLAGPVTTLLFGAEYADSSSILLVLSLGYFFHVAAGFNTMTLQVHGQVGYLVVTGLVSAVASVGAMLLLGQALGPVGVALGVTSGLVLHNVLNQVGLHRRVDLPLITTSHLRVVASCGLMVSVVWTVRVLTTAPLAVLVPLTGVLSLTLIYMERDRLQIDQMFPELSRVPWLGRLMSRSS